MASPFRVFPIAWATLSTNGWFYITSAIGALGWLEVYFPNWFYVFALTIIALVVVAAILEPGATVRLDVRVTLGLAASAAFRARFRILVSSVD